MTQFDKLFHFMAKPWVVILYAILVVLVYDFVDKLLAADFYQLDLRAHAQFLNVLTALGQWITYVVLFLFAGLYFRYIRINPVYETRIWYLLGCVFIANLFCFVLKIAVSRARPDLLFLNHDYGFYWFKLNNNYWSFPSGHTMTVVSLAVGLGVLFPRYFYVVLLAALFVAASRILLYHHYLSDVMSGFYFSVLVVGLFSMYLKKNDWFKKVTC